MERTSIRNGNGANDGFGIEIPETQRVVPNNPKAGLQDRQRHHKVGGQDDVLREINAQAMGVEWRCEDVGLRCRALRMLTDDVEVVVRFDQATRRCARGSEGGSACMGWRAAATEKCLQPM